MTQARFIDQYGRVARDLRLSVIDRCNLRCAYCLPLQGHTWIPRPQLLTLGEYERLVRIAIRAGVQEIRITGGEPLLRPDLEDIVACCHAELASAGLRPNVSVTTNGVGLADRLSSLVEAGLSRINISLDTLDPDRFVDITRRKPSQFDSILTALDVVQETPLSPVKINTVVMDDRCLAEIPSIVTMCLTRGFIWRAIEFMPIGPLAPSFGSRPKAADILRVLGEHFDISPARTSASAPAKLWRVRASAHHPAGQVGVIASMSAPFCADCDRTRLSANGRIYSCLFSDRYTDLLPLLRGDASDDEIEKAWAGAMWNKPAGHQLLPTLPASYSMSNIGG